MEYQQLLKIAFGDKLQVAVKEDALCGEFNYAGQDFALCGVVNEASLDNAMSANLAQFVLDTISKYPRRPICIIVDTGGQKVSHSAELLGLNSYFAHLIATFNLARANGHKIFALVYGKALGGAFIATALNADHVFALSEAQIAVMWLDAMSRVTKVPLAKLQELSQSSAIFAPGAENYVRLGALDAVVKPEEFMPEVVKLLNSASDLNLWREQGSSRGGRTLASSIVEHILAQ